MRFTRRPRRTWTTGHTYVDEAKKLVIEAFVDSVRVGDIEVSAVDAVVIEQGLNIALLGMSFLNRVEMQREGQSMVLIRRF